MVVVAAIVPKLVYIDVALPVAILFENIPTEGGGSVAVISLAFEMQRNIIEIRGVGQVSFAYGAIVDGIGKACSERPVTRDDETVGG